MLVTRFAFTKFAREQVGLFSCTRVSFRSRATRELYTKINGKHASMVYVSVKFKLSCTVHTMGANN